MIRLVINLYILILILDTVLSYLPQFRHTNWATKIREVANLTLRPIRRYMPADMPFDFSPVVAIVLLKLLVALW